MKRRPRPTLSLAALAVAGASLLLGCGSQTKTVSASSVAPTQPATGASARSSTGTATAPANTTPAEAGGTAASTTRTAPEPAFSQQETKAEGAGAAAALVRSKGYTPNNTSEYHEGQTLRVLVGTRTGSGDGYGQQAFFFLDGRYIGTDAKEPSATLRVLSQGDTEVTLAYPLYRPNDPLSSPTGGQAIVHFQLDNGRLTAIGTIPPASSKSALSRY